MLCAHFFIQFEEKEPRTKIQDPNKSKSENLNDKIASHIWAFDFSFGFYLVLVFWFLVLRLRERTLWTAILKSNPAICRGISGIFEFQLKPTSLRGAKRRSNPLEAICLTSSPCFETLSIFRRCPISKLFFHLLIQL
jgi:hypothetical protein